ncbi:WhiB family transcriptional regulator [Streptomyces sp. NPDC058548]|uniref:WhiB family transcriptional regulator n=1 Tax=unclassified Streptomyces TaxID=2593676 RepID=UPI003665FDFF
MSDDTSTHRIAIPGFLYRVDEPVPCTRMPGLFHPPDDGYLDAGERGRDRMRLALNLCQSCPVLADCREWARDRKEWGVWGGETDTQRIAAVRPERRLRKSASPAPRRSARRRPDPVGAGGCDAAWPPYLSPKQQAVLDLLASGYDRGEIAIALGRTRQSVAGVITTMCKKLRTDAPGIVDAARSAGLLPTVCGSSV